MKGFEWLRHILKRRTKRPIEKVVVETVAISEPIRDSRSQVLILKDKLLYVCNLNTIMCENTVVFKGDDVINCISKFGESTLVFASSVQINVAVINEDLTLGNIKVINVPNVSRIWALCENMIGVTRVEISQGETLLINRVGNDFVISSRCRKIYAADMTLISENELSIANPDPSKNRAYNIEKRNGMFELKDTTHSYEFPGEYSKCVTTQKTIVLIEGNDCVVLDRESRKKLYSIMMDVKIFSALHQVVAFEDDRFALLYRKNGEIQYSIMIIGAIKKDNIYIENLIAPRTLVKISENSFYVIGEELTKITIND